MGKSHIMTPWMPVYVDTPEKLWWQWHDNAGSGVVTHHPGIQIIANFTSGTIAAHMVFGPMPDPLPAGQMTLELAMLVAAIASKTVKYTPRWTSGVGDNDSSEQALSSEGIQTSPNFSGYSVDDYLVTTVNLDAQTPVAGKRLLMKLDFNSHAAWPAVKVTIQPSVYWVT